MTSPSYRQNDREKALRLDAKAAEELAPAGAAWAQFLRDCYAADSHDGYDAFWAGPSWFLQELGPPLVLNVLAFAFSILLVFGGTSSDRAIGVAMSGAAVLSMLLCAAVLLLADLAEMAHKTQEFVLSSSANQLALLNQNVEYLAMSLDKIRARQEQT